MATINCPYCDNVVNLKKARSGQGFPYFRCNTCNILVWFYGGVPSKKIVKGPEKGPETEKDIWDW